MILVYLGLGSNEAQPLRQIQQAISTLANHQAIKLQQCSAIYHSKPVDASKQSDFLNCALAIQTSLSPWQLLELCKDIEAKQQRVHHYRWGPRTIDIDILSYGSEVIKSDNLTIPHPEIANRDFVTLPLLELKPDLTLPILGTIANLTPPKNVYKALA